MSVFVIRVTLQDIMARETQYRLRRVGRSLRAACPICHSGITTRSMPFSIDPDTQRWFCFGHCKTGGDAIALIMRLKRCTWAEARRHLEAY